MKLFRCFLRLLWRLKLLITLTFAWGALEPFSGAYWLAEAIYFEARSEPLKGRWAVGNVVFNRIGHDSSPVWRKATGVGAIVDARVPRSGRCEFDYRCDDRSDNPWLDSYSLWDNWLIIRAEAWLMYGLYHTGVLYDITDGALFYKRYDAHNQWFARMVRDARMCSVPYDYGAHVFYWLDRCPVRLPTPRPKEISPRD